MGMYFCFLFFKFLLLFSAFMVILSKNAVHSVLFLVCVFINCSFLIMFLEADFLALILIVVYVGAIAVLFLFICMMLNIRLDSHESSLVTYMPLSSIFGILFIFELTVILYFDFNQVYVSEFINYKQIMFETSNIRVIGDILYTVYGFYFLLASLVLLLAMVGAIFLTLHHRKDVKRQVIYVQNIRENILDKFS